jgi:hypothetical protein
MDTHLIVNIVLKYYDELNQWTTARCLNNTYKKIVDEQKYDKTHCGRKSFIQPYFCCICETTTKDCDMLNYWTADFNNILHITHCLKWHCRISAIHSMLNHLKLSGLYMLRKPFQSSKTIIIPRSDGSETKGECKRYCLFKRDEWLVYTYWTQNNEGYIKLIPLTRYTQETPKLIFE